MIMYAKFKIAESCVNQKGFRMRMKETGARILRMVESDIVCEIKDKDSPFDSLHRFHNHDGYEIFLFLNGEASFYTENDMKPLSYGDLSLIPPYSFHHAIVQSKDLYNRVVVNIRDSYMKKICTGQTDLSRCFYRMDAQSINLIQLDRNVVGQFMEICHKLSHALKNTSYGDDILAETYLKQLLVSINRMAMLQPTPPFKNAMPDFVRDTFSYIESHLTEDIRLADLEREIHHNATYISRSFKKMSGITIQQFIIAKRIALAQELLREGHSPYDVCFLSGFNNYSNFSRTFTKETELSPKQYQQKIRRVDS